MNMRRTSAILTLVALLLLPGISTAQEATLDVPDEADPYWTAFKRCRAAKHPADTLYSYSFSYFDKALEQLLREEDPALRDGMIENMMSWMSICRDIKDVQSIRFRQTGTGALLEATFVDKAGEISAILFVFVDDPGRGPVIASTHINFSPDKLDLLKKCEFDPPPTLDTWLRCSEIGQAIRNTVDVQIDWPD